MSTRIDPQAPLGDLVTQAPGRIPVLESFGLDYCCGGQRSLAEACEQAGVDVIAVSAAIAESDAVGDDSSVDWASLGLRDLTDHIEETHHTYMHSALPNVTALVNKVAEVHGPNHPELLEVREVYGELLAEISDHLMKEEQVLFPLCRELAEATEARAFHCGSVGNPIRVMNYEHDSAGELLARLRQLTGDYTPPADACTSYQAMLAGLAELEGDLHLHIHKENNLLFPMALQREAELSA